MEGGLRLASRDDGNDEEGDAVLKLSAAAAEPSSVSVVRVH